MTRGDGIWARGFFVPESELSERFIQASGPGGQNVNKVASAVQLSFDLGRSTSLPPHVRDALRALAGSRLSKEGILTITARRFREQERNRADARARLASLIEEAAKPVKPRRPTKVPRSSKSRRRETKQRRGQIKQGRGRPPLD